MIKAYLKWRNQPSEKIFGWEGTPINDKVMLIIIALVSSVAFYYRITGRI